MAKSTVNDRDFGNGGVESDECRMWMRVDDMREGMVQECPIRDDHLWLLYESQKENEQKIEKETKNRLLGLQNIRERLKGASGFGRFERA